MIAALPEMTPVLNTECQLYFDGQHDRWVLKAPQQVIFPDHLTLRVLQACDGCCNGAQIVDSLSAEASSGQVSEDDVLDILDEYERRGFLSVSVS